MSEEGPLLQTGAPDAEARLWDKAPAWRTLTVAASLLTLAAVATPLLLPEPSPTSTPAKAVIAANAGKMLLPQAPHHDVALAVPPAAIPAPAPIRHAAASQAAAACGLTMPGVAHAQSPGTVAAFINPTESAVLLQQTEQQRGARIDPAYRNDPRVILRGDNGQLGRFTVPPGVHVALGDRVMVQSPFRNTALPCNFVPALITADLGPAPKAAAPPPAPPGDTENVILNDSEGKAPAAPP